MVASGVVEDRFDKQIEPAGSWEATGMHPTFVSMLSISATIDPRHAANITVYHVNQRSRGVLPINMNSADANGDL